MGVKVQLRFPTKGAKRGDVIEVADKATADALIANGSATAIKAAAKKSDEG